MMEWRAAVGGRPCPFPPSSLTPSLRPPSPPPSGFQKLSFERLSPEARVLCLSPSTVSTSSCLISSAQPRLGDPDTHRNVNLTGFQFLGKRTTFLNVLLCTRTLAPLVRFISFWVRQLVRATLTVVLFDCVLANAFSFSTSTFTVI